MGYIVARFLNKQDQRLYKGIYVMENLAELKTFDGIINIINMETGEVIYEKENI